MIIAALAAGVAGAGLMLVDNIMVHVTLVALAMTTIVDALWLAPE